MHSLTIYNAIDGCDVKLREYKNKIILSDKEVCRTFYRYRGISYKLNNGRLQCNIDTGKISKSSVDRCFGYVLSLFNKINGYDKVIRENILNGGDDSLKDHLENSIETKNRIMYLYPMNYIRVNDGYIDDEFNHHTSIKFRRVTMKGDIFLVEDPFNCIKSLSKTYCYYHNRFKESIKGKILLVRVCNKDLNSLYSLIETSDRPEYIFIIGSKNRKSEIERRYRQILSILTWTTDCNYVRKGKRTVITDVNIIKDDTKSNVNDILSISRVNIVPNTTESRILEQNGYILHDAVNALNIINRLNYKSTDNKTESEECSICADNISNVVTSCDHKMCLSCFVTFAMDSGGKIKCPYCRSTVDIDRSTVNTNYIPSRLYTMNWIANSKHHHRSIIYVDYENDKAVLSRLSKKTIIDLDDDHDIEYLNKETDCVMLASKRNINIVKKIRGIDNVVCRSDNNDIITERSFYGEDLINKTSKGITLSLYSYGL